MHTEASPSSSRNWKQSLKHELGEYFINVAYLTVFFTAYVLYRRMILAEYEIQLQDYFTGIIKALVIAKVIMLAAFLRVSRKFENKPLVIPVLYKSLLFTLCVVLFDLLEKTISGWIHTGSLSLAMTALGEEHLNGAWIASIFLVFVTFIPFFALKEMSRVFGAEKFRQMFFGGPDKTV